MRQSTLVKGGAQMTHSAHAQDCACGCAHEDAYTRAHEHTAEQAHAHGEACRRGEEEQAEEDPDSSARTHGEVCACAHASGPSGEEPRGKEIYILENLGCANCAAKMEAQIAALDGVRDVSITFATRQLRLTAKNPAALLPRIREVCTSIEPGVGVVPRKVEQKKDAEESAKGKRALPTILIGAALLVGGKLMEGAFPLASAIILMLGYLLLGWEILLQAGRNLLRGRIFDENFLMSVATLGAFIIGEYAEAVGVMLFFRIGDYFEYRAMEKSRKQIMGAVDMRPETVGIVDGDNARVIPAEDARVGDVLLVRPGDRIPLDGVIVEGESRIDTSPVTGEPVPVAARPGSNVLSGCVNVSGLIRLRVERPLDESMVTRILDSVENAAAMKPQMDRFITRFARIYTPIVLALALAVAVIPPLLTGNWYYWVYTALTFLVISCPCALVLSVPLAFFSGIGAGSKRGILFKGGATLEMLGKVKAVVMDKTGTVTRGDFTVRELLPAEGVDADALLALAAGCEAHSTHPIAASIVAAARERGVDIPVSTSVGESAGKGVTAVFPEGEALCGNRALLADYGVALPDALKDTVDTEVLLAVNGRYAGQILIADGVKDSAKAAVAGMKKLGAVTSMLTGDSAPRAKAVADEVGIDEVRAKLLPQDKVDELISVRRRHGAVLYVGDGINDAPVLAAADVGAAMGSGADAAIEVADVVFMNSSLLAVPQSFDIAKRTLRIAMQNVAFALAVKAVVMVLGLFGFASMWMAVFADTGVSLLCILNSIRILFAKDYR